MKSAIRSSFFFLILLALPLAAQQRSQTLIDRILDGDTVLTPSSTSSVLSHSDDIHWDGRFGMPGANREVKVVAVDEEWVYAGGLFTYIGNTPASYIARWSRKTHQWKALGGGVNGVVLAIAVKGDSIIVGGQFTGAGGVSARNIAVWNKRTGEWLAMGQGGSGDLQAYVSAIAVSGEEIYVGGRFTAMGTLIANNVARWDGSGWDRLGAGVNMPVYAMLVDGKNVYVGGEFTAAGQSSAAHIAKWDGTEWHAMGESLDGGVYAITKMNDTVYVGGTFQASGATSLGMIAWWDDNAGAWRPVGTQNKFSTPDHIYSLAAKGDTLFVAGIYDTDITTNILLWSHGQWQGLHSAGDSPGLIHTLGELPPKGIPPIKSPTVIYTIAADDENLYLGGTFPYSYYELGLAKYEYYVETASVSPHIVAWNTSQQRFITMGAGVNNVVNALVRQETSLYVGGNFTSAAGMVASKVVRWSDGEWTSMAEGLNAWKRVQVGSVQSLAANDGKIYAGGIFGQDGDTSDASALAHTSNVAEWNAAMWNHFPVTRTMSGTPETVAVNTVVSFSGRLYYSSQAGIRSWQDTAWSTDNIPDLPQSDVITMAVDGNSYLYAGTRYGLYRWDGSSSTWTTIGVTDDSVMTIAIDDDRVYIGGRFTKVDNLPVKYIAMYSTESKTWISPGNGVDRFTDPLRHPFVASLAISNGRLYAGGLFQTAGDVTVNNIAMWDGEVWSSFGSGVDTAVNAVIVDGDDVYIGGAFRVVGGTTPSWYVAHWNATQLSADPRKQTPLATAVQLVAVPNPAGTMATIHYNLPTGDGIGPVSLVVYDALGREVAIMPISSSGTTTVDTSMLSPGVYYCRLRSETVSATARLVIVH